MKKQAFCVITYLLLALAALGVLLLCVCCGSVAIPLKEAFSTLYRTLLGLPTGDGLAQTIILPVRLPRILCAALVGAALSLSGAAMQGLLKNPLADGSTLGISSGASLGAVLSIAFSITIPSLPFAGTSAMAAVFAFCSLLVILTLSFRLDGSLCTHTIILVGVIFSMFVSSIMSLIISLAPEKVREITFWTMGSLTSASYEKAFALAISLVVFGGGILTFGRELNAFSISEQNASNVGVAVRRVKLTLLVCVSCLIGVCVSVGGTIGFVGLVIPHIMRLLVGPNHQRLLPASLFAGAIFLMLADLLSRTIFSPRELPVGVVTSFFGSIVFVVLLFRARRAKK